MTVNQLVQQFSQSGSFGAGRLARACDIFEHMIRDKECTVFLSLAGAMVPAGLRRVISDLIRRRLIDALVSTGANMVHDLLEAFGGHHYKGHWAVDDTLLYRYHLARIYDIFVPEEHFVEFDRRVAELFEELASQVKGSILPYELMWEIGKRINDHDSIIRASYETGVPIFLPALRDSEFAYAYHLHLRRCPQNPLKIDTFREIAVMVDLARRSPRLGMVVLGGGVPRNTTQHVALMADKSIDYAVVITMDRPETGGLSGSTLEETVSWGKVKMRAEKIMVIGDALIVFPVMVAAVLERLGKDFRREHRIPVRRC